MMLQNTALRTGAAADTEMDFLSGLRTLNSPKKAE
jgi:hypothetical protein